MSLPQRLCVIVVLSSAYLLGIVQGSYAAWSSQEAVTPADSVQQVLSEVSHHCIDVDGSGEVHVVWQDWRGPGSIYYNSRTPPSGWGAESFRVDPPGVYVPEDPTVCCDPAGNVFVAWHVQGDTTGRPQVNYRMCFASTGWETGAGLVDNSRSYSPSAVMDDSGSVHVVWLRESHPLRNQVMYRKLVPGQGWSDDLALSGSSNSYSSGLTIAEQAGSLYVVWAELNNSTDVWDVYYRGYTPGDGWDAAPTQVTIDGDGWSPSVAVGPDGCLFVVFTMQGTAGAHEIFFRAWSPSSGWDGIVTAVSSNDGIHSRNPDVACDDLGLVHVVWHDAREASYEIYERVYTPGTGWGDEAPLTANENGDLYPHLISGTCGMHLVWHNGPVYYKNYVGKSSGIPGTDRSGDDSAGRQLIVGASPNPFNGRTVIDYQLPGQMFLTLRVFSVTGQLVAELASGCQGAGAHSIIWEGHDFSGRQVQPGVYFVTLHYGDLREVRAIVLLN